jgi:hypothetical protein
MVSPDENGVDVKYYLVEERLNGSREFLKV